jgi:hypothetical protein
MLEQTIKSKNPNSIPMLLKANKETTVPEGVDPKLFSDTLKKVRQLEGEMTEKDDEFERKLRTMRQEQERLRAHYERRQG